MLQLQDLPDHVLLNIISFAIDATQFKGWQLSLRLVNRKFKDKFGWALAYTTSLL